MKLFQSFTLALVFLNFAFCQENAGTSLSPALEVCYNNTRMRTREYRLPSTINVLVEVIRKIEDGNSNQDARELSYQILHRFRQDGIQRSRRDLDSSQGLPYSPKGWEASKNRIQLTKLTPGNAINFNNGSVTSLQACSLHYMISSTIETQERGDESNVCNRIARYTDRIQKRQIELTETTFARSTCPIESGVIYTKWGAVKAGLVLAGIASGFQPQVIKTNDGNLQNTYASTIAGELSEVALNQEQSTKTVGNKGGWNNTVEPKYYFLEQSARENLFLTDAEIRGGLDGLYLALNINNWKSTNNNLKISQILDLYYSRGVFNSSSRACNRKTLIDDLIANSQLVNETALFNDLLNKESTLSYTPKRENFPIMAQAAVDSLRNYLRSNLVDLECSSENEVLERVSTDVIIFIDTNWNHQIIQPFVSYILENIDINKYESTYTILDGANCNTIVNKSRSILDFYEKFNLTEQQKFATGFDYSKVIQVAENLFRNKLNNETDLTTSQSTIILMLPHNTPTSAQSEYVRTKRNDFRSNLPDLRIIVGGSGTASSYNDLVTSANSDIFIIPDNTEYSRIKETGSNIVERFKKLPRGVVNSKCGSSFVSGTYDFEVTQYVEPKGVNYHKISPNYFYEGQTLKIKGQGYGTLVVCTSRTDTNPRANTTGTDCKSITSDEHSMDISNYCTDESVTECSSIYLSLEGITSNNRCTDQSCRFPDSIKYIISLEQVECSSSAEKLFSSILIISVLFAIMRF